MDNWPRSVRALLLIALCALATALPAASASAGVLVNSESAANCGTQTLSQPFKRWGESSPTSFEWRIGFSG